jgi:phenylacetate-CoA ligase
MDDRERYPTLSENGARLLQFMREHPNAPIYRNASGNRLTAEDLEALREFERDILQKSFDWSADIRPYWLPDFAERVFADVPYYRQMGAPPKNFLEIPSVNRAAFAADITRFVPDSIALDRLINFQTTGTTGNPLLIASHPRVAASYLSFHKKALLRCGIELRHGRGQVGVVLVGYQSKCFTYVSVTPTMDESGLAKINLHPDDWRNADDRALYLDALNPEIITGDPLSFAELMKLPLRCRPRALISVGMMLAPGFKAELEARFQAPVLDIYSLNEAGPVAVFDVDLRGHLLLQPDLYVEILDTQDRPVVPGERGEITLTGGFNFCLPLLRYRTGDFAALSNSAAGPVLMKLSGRAPVRYKTASGEWINNIDITHALRPIPIAQFGFHQCAHGTLTLRLAESAMDLALTCQQALVPVFGVQAIKVEVIKNDGKILQYTSDFSGEILG